jgi:hypothetical protein
LQVVMVVLLAAPAHSCPARHSVSCLLLLPLLPSLLLLPLLLLPQRQPQQHCLAWR